MHIEIYCNQPVEIVFLAIKISLLLAIHSYRPTCIKDYKRPLRNIHVLSSIIDIPGVFDNTVYIHMQYNH